MQALKLIIVCLFTQLIILINGELNQANSAKQQFPISLDWRTKGVITPPTSEQDGAQIVPLVMVETIESLYAIKTGTLIRGSVARVADCCSPLMVDYDCVAKLGGICRNSDYPSTRGTCEPNACIPFATFDKLVVFRGLDDEQLLPFIQNGTLLISITATSFNVLGYTGGVFKDQTCSYEQVNHVVQLVGYGQNEMGEKFWIVKNSWGDNWGENGFMRILRGKNICNIATEVYQPLIVSQTVTLPTPTPTTSRATRIFCVWIFILLSIIFPRLGSF